jgi:multidrug efflux pump subunit AcrB
MHRLNFFRHLLFRVTEMQAVLNCVCWTKPEAVISKKWKLVVRQFISDLKARPEIASAFTIFDASFPQYTLHIDIDKAAQKGVTISNAMGSLQTLLGSEYATNFIRFGQMYKVMVQACLNTVHYQKIY